MPTIISDLKLTAQDLLTLEYTVKRLFLCQRWLYLKREQLNLCQQWFNAESRGVQWG